jgi:GTP pyrophosphokinase
MPAAASSNPSGGSEAHAGRGLSRLRLRAPEQAAGSHLQGVRSELRRLAMETTKLVRVQRQARAVHVNAPATPAPMAQTRPRRPRTCARCCLAFSRDLRVVMLRLASRLQTLRHFAATKKPVRAGLARESLQVFAPLANRLGIWQIKWEMEDLAFRFLEPDTYKQVASLLDEKRAEREASVEQLARPLEAELASRTASPPWCRAGPSTSTASCKKMRGKSLDFQQVFDIRALRVVVGSVAHCYAGAGQRARPLHAGGGRVRRLHRPAQGQWLPVAAHRGARRARARPSRSRSAPRPCTTTPSMAWQRTGPTRRPAPRAMPACLRGMATTTPRSPCCGNCWPGSATWPAASSGLFDDRIYVLTPDAAIVELPRAPRRWTSPTACTPTWATAAAARGGRRDGAAEHAAARTARPWRSRWPRRAGPRATGSTPTWVTWPATAPRPRCGRGSTCRRAA